MAFFNTTPDMPADPVSGFFAGFTSIFSRIFIGWAAIFLACTLCYVCAVGLNAELLIVWAMGSLGMIFAWATLGGWFILGLAALVTMFFCLWSFVTDSGGKFVFFLMFTAGVVYFFPLDIASEHWLRAAVTYAIVAACYWLLPRAIAAMLPQPIEEIEVAAPLEEPDAAPLHADDAEVPPHSWDHEA
jgi:hypothetical protein